MGKKKNIFITIAVILVFCSILLGISGGCQFYNKEQLKPSKSEEATPKVEKELIRKHLEKLVSEEFQGRRAGTQGEAETALYLAQELKNQGLEPMGDKSTFFQSFPLPGTGLRWETKRLIFYLQDDSLELLSDNILGIIKSTQRPEEYIILSAHFDHLGSWQNQLYSGANDNASGVSAVLEISRILSIHKEDLPYSIIIAFWGAEEMGLIGSNYFIDNPSISLDKIKLAINLDSIGSGAEKEFLYWSAGPFQVTESLLSYWQKWPEINLYRQDNPNNTSDHKALARGSIPAVTILAKDWLTNNHTAQDDIQNINYEKIVSLSQKIVDFLNSSEIIDTLKKS